VVVIAGRPPQRADAVILNVGVSSSAVCGVRDYSHALAGELRGRGLDVSDVWADIPARRTRASIETWLSQVDLAIASRRPDIVLLHYSVFSYSWRGIPLANIRISARLRQTEIPLVAVLHEFVYPWGHRGVRGLVQAVTQRIALRPLVRVACALLVTTPERAAWLAERAWLPVRPTTFVPVFSNIPLSPTRPAAVTPNVIVFGYSADAAQCADIAEAVAEAAQVVDGLGLLLVGGPGPDNAISRRWAVAARRAGCRLSFTGVLGYGPLSTVLASASLAVFPDSSGPTSRKGTLAALLCHGCPIIAYDGRQTWRDLVDAEALVVVPPDSSVLARTIVRLMRDDGARARLSEQARGFYRERMEVGRAADAMVTVLTSVTAAQCPVNSEHG
jgi:glycosyltransferase involved in cell wall biosynthesis